ncbi:MAG: sugar ABC transporter permease [Spirochaetes bacterium]|nr:sugar ABC transporter permease [Spirochaetota bacterium]
MNNNYYLKRNIKNNSFYYMIFLPAFVVIVFLTVYPIFNVFHMSFFKYNYLSDTKKFFGFTNFIRIITDRLFQKSFINTIIFSAAATFAEVGIGLFLALLFYGFFKGKRLFMITIIFPMMISTMVICSIWKTLYHYDIGLFNYILKSIGLHPVGWLINPKMALFSVIIVDIWQWTPFAFIILQAGLNTIPGEIFEAASIDGANYYKTIKLITLPILFNQILLVILLRTIDTFRIFGKVYALTQGGPGNATETVTYYVYREGFTYFNLGRASTASIYILIVISLISVLYIRNIMREEK